MKLTLAAAFIIALSPDQAKCAEILDQSVVNPVTTAYSIIQKGFTPGIGFSFTAGVSGSLSRVDISLYNDLVFPPTGPARNYDSGANINFRDEELNLIGTALLTANQIAPRTSFDPAAPFNISLSVSGINVLSGNLYYVLVQPTRVVPLDFGGNGLALLAASEIYAGGNPVIYSTSGGPRGSVSPFFAESNDVLFRTYVTTPSAVPEPATWGMMIAGFGLTGAVMRRRRRITAVAAA